MSDHELFVGEALDEQGARSGERVGIAADALTTHGVILGMTGSGKTGLGVALIEEALSAGTPVLALDPKGDLANLLLTFPQLRPEDFAPWVGADADPAAVAAQWSQGLADWGLGTEQISALRAGVRMSVYTPGSTAATPLNLVGDLSVPSGADPDDEGLVDEVDALTAGLLGLVGVTGDPLASPEHLLVSNLVHAAWAGGESLDLGTLLTRIQAPPMRKLGVMDLDTVIPPERRTALAVRLNGVLATPGFAPWSTGAPLDIQRLLWAPDGRPSLALVSLSHLSDPERQLAVSRILAALVRWFRGQPGSERLRVLVYVDEVAGYAPPTAEPATKQPIMTILKQARAFGVGMVLATQNPVDLDYKALSNAGTWMVGRLQTEQDTARLLDGMSSASGGVDRAALEREISALGKRQFLLHRTSHDRPVRFTTRWVMSYLAGPITGAQLALLPGREELEVSAPVDTSPAAPATPSVAEDESTVMPKVADGVVVRHLDPAAPWAAQLGAVAGGTRLVPAVALRVQLTYDEAKADLRHTEEWEAVLFPLEELVDPAAAVAVDHDERDFTTTAPEGARYVTTSAPLHTKRYFTDLSNRVRDSLVRDRTVSVPVNRQLSLWGRVGEDDAQFAARCDDAAQQRADAEAEKVRAKLAARIDRLRAAVDTAEQRAASADLAARDARGTELTGTVGSVLGGLLGGRRRTRSLATSARRVMSGRERVNRAERRAQDAADAVASKVDELGALEEELAEQLVEIDQRWADAAAAVERVEVPLERADVTVEQLLLVWVPTSGA